MKLWLVFILAMMIQMADCFAQEVPIHTPWHYKDYTVKVIPGPSEESMRELQIIRKNTILTHLFFIDFILPNDLFPVRDITGNGHKEISIVEDCPGMEGGPCQELYLYELEPSFKLLGHFAIDNTDTQSISYDTSGLRITVVGVGYCSLNKDQCENTDGGAAYLYYDVIYKNGKFMLDTDSMKKPLYHPDYIKNVINVIQKIATDPTLSSEEKLFQNHNETKIQSYKFFYDGNGQFVENLIDTVYTGTAADKKLAFNEVKDNICSDPYGADILAMSAMTCPATKYPSH